MTTPQPPSRPPSLAPLPPSRGTGRWPVQTTLTLLAFLCITTAAAQSEVTLDPLYREHCRRPCEHVGFSFSDSLDEVRQMLGHGANACGTGSMWVPTEDPDAPYGAGVPDAHWVVGTTHLGQSFSSARPFTGVALATPTFTTEGSGCTLSLYSAPPDHWDGTEPRPMAREAFSNVQDNQRLWMTFDELPAGAYYIEQAYPSGDAIGVWAAGEDTCPDGRAYVSRKPIPEDDLELWLRTDEGDTEIVAPGDAHHAIRLGAGALGRIADARMSFAFSVGNWNNGGFPYYPDWFIERFPDMAMLDQNGQPIMAGMFDELDPWPSIDHPAIVDGTRRHIRSLVGALRENPGLLYWVMGGEALYATYLYPSRWTDYSDLAVAHYRAWLQREYGSVEALNEAWATGHAAFSAVEPPREPARDLPTLDWFRFRNAAMAERFQWHFAETKAADPGRLVVSGNHGNIFHDMAGTWMGQDMALYAGMSDGWEMGQIMSDDDPDLYNLMWMRTAAAFGKPLCPVRLAYKKSDPKARGGGTSYTPETAHRYFWESVGTGAWHMGFIQWRGDLPDGEWGVKGTPAQAEIKRIFDEWHSVESYFTDMWPVKGKVGIYLSQPTWTLDGFQPVWTELHKELTRRQIDYRFLFDSHLLTDNLAGLKTVISADNRVIGAACREALERIGERHDVTLLLLGENATEDENLRPVDASLRPVGVQLPSNDLTPLWDALDGADTRMLTVAVTSDQPYTEPAAVYTLTSHDTPHDLAGHNMGQTFLAEDGLVSVAVSNPTYNQTVAEGSLTLELLATGPAGEPLAEKTYGPDELTDNAWHEVVLEAPAPAGTYYLRLTASADIEPTHLGVWGTSADAYPDGQRFVDDAPAEGDLRLRVRRLAERPPSAAIEAFPMSDGLNAMVLLTNISSLDMGAVLTVSPELLGPSETFKASNLTGGRAGMYLSRVPRETAHASVPVPAHRTAAIYFGADVDADVRARAQRLREWIADLPVDATRPHRAHFLRAKGSSSNKGLASILQAEGRAPLTVSAAVADGRLTIRAEAPEGTGEEPLLVTFVPLPGKVVELPPTGGEAYEVSVPLRDLGTRYDYEAQSYRPYHGAVEVNVTGRIADRIAAASCVVEVPET